MAERDQLELAHQARAGLVHELRRPGSLAESEALTRSAAMGLQPAPLYVPVVFRLDRIPGEEPIGTQRRERALLDLLHRVMASSRTTAPAASLQAGSIALLLPVPAKQLADPMLEIGELHDVFRHRGEVDVWVRDHPFDEIGQHPQLVAGEGGLLDDVEPGGGGAGQPEQPDPEPPAGRLPWACPHPHGPREAAVTRTLGFGDDRTPGPLGLHLVVHGFHDIHRGSDLLNFHADHFGAPLVGGIVKDFAQPRVDDFSRSKGFIQLHVTNDVTKIGLRKLGNSD